MVFRVPASTHRLAIALAAACSLAACGGGVWIGIGDTDGDRPPQVSLAAPASAGSGQGMRLVAAASDDDGVAYVSFYRIEPDGTVVRLGDDSAPPYQWDAVMPSGAAGSVRFFARVVDSVGQWAESEGVSVAVAP